MTRTGLGKRRTQRRVVVDCLPCPGRSAVRRGARPVSRSYSAPVRAHLCGGVPPEL